MEAVEETITALVAEIKTLRKQVKTLSATGGKVGKKAPTMFNKYMKKQCKKLQKLHPKWAWGRCWNTAAGKESRGDAYELYKEKHGVVAKPKKAPKKAVVSDSESDEEVAPKKKAPKKKAPKKKVVVEESDSDSDSDSDSEEETPPPKKTVKAPKKKVVVEESETDEEEVAPPACE